MKRILIGLLLLATCLALGVVYLVAFGTAKPPAPLSSVIDPFAAMDRRRLPPIERYCARDGAQLSYRSYPAGERLVAVLIHGSSGSSADMHAMSMALQAAGVTVYVPDLRGHGANQPRGDLAYTGQLDDDMADFVRIVKPRHQGARWTLLGFSSGGGYVLRVAAGALGQSFDQYILLSPFLRYDAPTIRDTTHTPKQQWSTVSTGRIVGLLALGRLGIHHFDGLPVINFAVPPNIPSVTASYSWRMLQSFQPDNDYLSDIRLVSRPMQVLVGSEDELFVPEKFQQVFNAANRNVPVTIMPGLGHVAMVTSPQAIQAVVAAIAR